MNRPTESDRTPLKELAQAIAPNKPDIQAELIQEWGQDLEDEDYWTLDIDIGHFQLSLGLTPRWEFEDSSNESFDSTFDESSHMLSNEDAEVITAQAAQIIKRIEEWSEKHRKPIHTWNIYRFGIPYGIQINWGGIHD